MIKRLSLFLMSLFVAFTVNAQQLLFEDFTDFPSSYSGDPISSPGWSEAQGLEGALVTGNAGWYGAGYSDRMATFGFSEYNSSDYDEWLITPVLDLTQNAGKNTLSFVYNCSFSQPLGNDFVKIMISTDGGTSFSTLKEFTRYSIDLAKEMIDLSAYSTNNNVKIAFYAHDSGSDDYNIDFSFDKITVDATPAVELAVLSNIDNSNVTADTTVFISNTATFSTAVKNFGKETATATVKMLVNTAEVNSTSVTINTGETAIVAFPEWTAPETEGEYSINFILENDLDVDADNNNNSIKVKVYEPYTSLTENFDASTDMPSNWYSFINSSGSNPTIQVKSYYKAFSAPNCLYLNDGTTYVSELSVSTPALKLIVAEKYRASFQFNGSSTSSSLKIFQASNLYDKSTYQELNTFNLEVSYTNQLCEFEFIPTETTYIVFAYNSPSKFVYIDDFNIEKVQDYELNLSFISEEASVAAGLSTAYKYEIYNKGAKDATVKFTKPSSEKIDFSVLDETEENTIESISILAGQKAIVTLKMETTDITEATVKEMFDFSVFVEGHTDISALVNTNLDIYKPLNTLNEGFETGKVIPALWTKYEVGATNLIRFFQYASYAHDGEGYVQLGNSSADGANARLITPLLAKGACYNVSVFASGGGSLVIGTQTNPALPETYTKLQTIDVSSSYEQYFITVKTLDEAKSIVFSNLIDGTYDKALIDDVVITELPAIDPELSYISKQNSVYSGASDQFYFSVQNKGYNEATFNISATGNWEYLIFDKEGVNAINEITLGENESDTLMIKFTAAQVTDIDLTENCDVKLAYTLNTEKKEYNKVFSLNAYKPYKELVNDFEVSENLPEHFSCNIEGDNGVSVTTTNAYSENNCIKLRKSFDATGATILALPAFENYSGGYNISFYAIGGNSAIMEIGTISSMEGFNSFIKLGEITPVDEYAQYQIRVKPSDNKYLAIKNNVAGGVIYMDSLVIKPYPVTLSFNPLNETENVNVDIHPTITFSKAVRLIDNTELTTENIKPFVEIRKDSIDGELINFSVNIANDFTSVEIIPEGTLNDNQVYVVSVLDGLEDYENNTADNEYITFTTEDNTAPEFIDSYPVLSDVTISYADIKVNVNEDAKAYYLTVAANATVPSANQVITGENYDDVVAIGAGNLPLKANAETILSVLGLEDGTSYDVYLALIDVSSNANVNENVVKVSIETPDITAPEFNTNYPELSDVSATSADLKVSVNENAKVYYLNLAHDSKAPTAEQVISGENYDDVIAIGNGSLDVLANTEMILSVNGLEDETKYDVYLALVDLSSNINVNVVKVGIETPDITAPEFNQTYPQLAKITATSADIKVSVNENAKVYYLNLARDSKVPTAEQVIAGVNYNDVIVVSSGNQQLIANKESTLSVSELEDETNYDVYFALVDVSPNNNVNENIAKIGIETSDVVAPQFNANYPVLSSVSATSADIKVSVNENANVYFLNVTLGSDTPTAEQVIAGKNYNDVVAISAGNMLLNANTETILSISELEDETKYDVYLALVDISSNISNDVVKINIETTDITATEFIENYPSVDNITTNEAILNLKINELSDIYMVVMTTDSEDPTVDKLINELESINSVYSETFELNENIEVSKTIEKLTPNTEYKICLVAVDKSGNKQSDITKKVFTTEKEATGINDINTTSVKVWPNPVTAGILNVNTNEKSDVIIFNSLGIKVNETNDVIGSMQISVSNLDTGIYFVVVKNQKISNTQKIIIK